MRKMCPHYSYIKPFLVFVMAILTFPAETIFAQEFTKLTNSSLPGVENSSTSWGDYDNDGDLDILFTGSLMSKVYKNNGNGTFSAQTAISLTGVESGSAAWGDYDNDGYLDILLTGWNGGTSISKIYRNLGNGSFNEQSNVSLAEVNSGSAVWGDYNNDGFQDILLTGIGKSEIYKNKGNGTFTEQTSISLPGMRSSSAAWGDYNNDGFLDLLLTGWDDYAIPTSQIYKNNGDGTFSLQTNIKLTGVSFSAAAWGDYNNDGYLDVLLTGSTSNNGTCSKVYKNNQDGTFSEQTAILLTGVSNSSVAWGDYNNDGFPDILLTGRTGNGPVSKIYKNNGNGTFTEQTSISLTGVESGCATWADYDNDGDLDILLTGSGKSEIYQNNNNQLNTVPSAPSNLSAAVSFNKVTFIWDKSSDNETPQNGLNYNLIIGTVSSGGNILSSMSDHSSGYRRVVRLGNAQVNNSVSYILPGGTYYWSVQAIDGSFAGSKFSQEKTFTIQQPVKVTSPLPGEVWIVSSQHSISWSENRVANIRIEYSVNNGLSWYTIVDSIAADSGSYRWTVPNKISNECKIRLSDAANPNSFALSDSTFSIIGLMSDQGPVLPDGVVGYVAWGDYDNDGDLDILLSGGNGNAYEAFSKIYKNNGDGTFSELNNISLPNISGGSASWEDYDNDGDLDILITGADYNYNRMSKIYKNYGNGIFSLQTNIQLTGVDHGSVDWGDYNNDGLPDILLTGNTGNTSISKIYKNNKNGTFTEQTSISLPGVEFGSACWGDYDNDGDQDILLTGSGISQIWRNNGDGSFSKQSAALTGMFYSSAAWGDYDNDGDLDILITGSSLSNTVSMVYKNNGNGTFSGLGGAALAGISLGSATWADYDNDGDLDILLSGSGASKIYKNNGNGTFTEQTNITLAGVDFGTAIWGDYDNDGDLDILLTGYSDKSGRFTKIYKNNSSVHNTCPTAPAGLNTVVDGNKVTFSWDKSSDNETPQNGLNYNLVIRTMSKGINILSPMSDSLTGYRRIVKAGNSLINSHIIKDLPAGTYYWSVQAIDEAFAGSKFSSDKSFTVQLTDVQEKNNPVHEYRLMQNYPNPFNPTTNISFLLPVGQKVKLTIYDMLGKEISTLLNEYMPAGSHSVEFNAASLPNGVYIYTLQTDRFRDSKKLILLK